jgi:hypothetical protein
MNYVPSIIFFTAFQDFKYIIHQQILLTSGNYRMGRAALEQEK